MAAEVGQMSAVTLLMAADACYNETIQLKDSLNYLSCLTIAVATSPCLLSIARSKNDFPSMFSENLASAAISKVTADICPTSIKPSSFVPCSSVIKIPSFRN
jgi:hypothetical protein